MRLNDYVDVQNLPSSQSTKTTTLSSPSSQSDFESSLKDKDSRVFVDDDDDFQIHVEPKTSNGKKENSEEFNPTNDNTRDSPRTTDDNVVSDDFQIYVDPKTTKENVEENSKETDSNHDNIRVSSKSADSFLNESKQTSNKTDGSMEGRRGNFNKGFEIDGSTNSNSSLDPSPPNPEKFESVHVNTGDVIKFHFKIDKADNGGNFLETDGGDSVYADNSDLQSRGDNKGIEMHGDELSDLPNSSEGFEETNGDLKNAVKTDTCDSDVEAKPTKNTGTNI